MSPHLSSGRYVISNNALSESVGRLHNPSRVEGPILSTSDRPLWVVEHVADKLYRLTLDGFKVVESEKHLLRSTRSGDKRWRIEQRGDGNNQYIIVDPDSGNTPKAWTLREGDSQVSLKELSGAHPGDSTQLWLFDPIRDNHKTIQKKLKLGPSSGVYRYGSHGYLGGLIHHFRSSSAVASLVIEPGSPEDLVKIVTYVAKNQVPFAVRGGGHTSNPGFSSTRGIQISMSRFNDIVYHYDDEIVDIGAGCVFREVYDSLPRDRNIVGGSGTSPVGVSGWLLGGGYSFKTNKYGLGIDNIVAVQIVVPNDNGKVSVKTVTADDDEELFWAIKGGGNNFGIVTRFTLKTYPQNKVYGGPLVYTQPEETTIKKIKEAIIDFIDQDQDKAASVVATFRHFPDKKFEITVQLFFDNPLPTPNPFQKFLDISPSLASDNLQTLAYNSLDHRMSRVHDFSGPLGLEFSTSPSGGISSFRATPRPAMPGMGLLNIRGRWGNVMISKYNKDLIDHIETELKTAADKIDAWNGTMIGAGIWPFHPEMFENSADGAWPHDHDKPSGPCHFYLHWVGEEHDEDWIGKLKEVLKSVRDKAIELKCTPDDAPVYLNTALAEDDYSTLKNIYRGNLDKLSELREKYDPCGIMNLTGGFHIPFPDN